MLLSWYWLMLTLTNHKSCCCGAAVGACGFGFGAGRGGLFGGLPLVDSSTHGFGIRTAPNERCQPAPSVSVEPSLGVLMSTVNGSSLLFSCHWPVARLPSQPVYFANVAPDHESSSNTCSAYVPSFGSLNRAFSNSPAANFDTPHSSRLPSDTRLTIISRSESSL